MAAERFSGKAMPGSEFDDVAMSQSTFTNVNLAGSKVTNCDLTQVAITESNTAGMTIDGILVTDALAAWRTANPGGNLQDRH